MLTNRTTGPLPDQNEAMTGTCSTCRTVVRCPRYQAVLPDRRMQDGNVLWNDQPYTECPCCKSRSLKRQGNRVYLVPERQPTKEELAAQVVYKAIHRG